MNFKNLVADAGNFSAADADYIKSLGGDHTEAPDNSIAVITRKPGKYQVTIKSGRKSHTEVITLTSGKLVVGDLCYSFQGDNNDAWDKVCNDLWGNPYRDSELEIATTWDEECGRGCSVTLKSVKSLEKKAAKKLAEENKVNYEQARTRWTNLVKNANRLKAEAKKAKEEADAAYKEMAEARTRYIQDIEAE